MSTRIPTGAATVMLWLRCVSLAGSIAAATATAMMAVLVAAALLGPRDRAAIRHHLTQVIASGEINRTETAGPFQSRATPYYVYECLLFSMLATETPDRFIEFVANRWTVLPSGTIDSRVPPFPDCQSYLRVFPQFGADGAANLFVRPYDNYILGMRTVGQMLLSWMSVPRMAGFLLTVSYGLLAIVAGIAAVGLLRANDRLARERFAGFLAIGAVLATFYGVRNFGHTLNFGVLDCTHFVFILVALLFPLSEMRFGVLALYGAAYGSCVAIFEFLSGGIPFALALLPMMLALGFRGDWKTYAWRIVTVWGCFCLAVVICFAIKKFLAYQFLAEPMSFLGPLSTRMSREFVLGPLPERLIDWGFTDRKIREGMLYGLAYLAVVYAYFSYTIAWGSPMLGTFLAVSGAAIVVVMSWRHHHAMLRFKEPLIAASLLSFGSLLCWGAVFFNHTILHPFQMARLLVVPIIAGALVLTTGAIRKRAD